MKLNPSKSNAELFQLDLWSHRSRRAAPFVRLATLGPPERSFPRCCGCSGEALLVRPGPCNGLLENVIPNSILTMLLEQ